MATNIEQPLASIVIPCYNQSKFLKETLISIINQHYEHWECIIIDDGSTDHTSSIARQFESKDKRFKLFVTPNQGVAKARNFGIQQSIGTYILPLDGDDLISDSYLKEAINAFENNPKLKVVYSHAQFIGFQKGIWDLEPYSYKNLLRSNMIFCSGVFKKNDFDTTEGYDPHLTEGLEDWEFWIQLLKNGGEVLKLPKLHFYYRIHEKKGDSRSNKISQEIELSLRKKIYEKHSSTYHYYWPTHQLLFDYKQLNEQLISTKFLLNQIWHAGWRSRINNIKAGITFKLKR